MGIISIFFRQNKNLGKKGEEIAAQYLKSKGYKILERNYRNKTGRQLGEIDIIACQKNDLVFVEVKTRQSKKHQNVLPEESITRTKLHRLNKIAAVYLHQKNFLEKLYRFDAVSVWLDNNEKIIKIRHLKNIFF